MWRAHKLLRPAFFLVDLALVAAALALASMLRKRLGWGMPLVGDVSWVTPQVYAAAAVAWTLAFFAVGAHRPRRAEEGGAWPQLVLSDAFGLLLFLAGLFFLKVYDFSRLLIAYFFAAALVLHLARHVMTVVAARRLARPFARRVVLVGAGEIGEEVARRLQGMPWGMRLVGAVGSDPVPEGCTRLGGMEELSAVIQREQVEDVFIALPAEQHAKVEDVILKLQSDPVRVHFVPDVLEITMIRAQVNDFFGIPVVGLREPPIDDAGRLAKRIFDLVFGAIATLLASPLMIGTALAIKLEDGGPVFFKQKRIGENGEPFEMLKFRSMCINAEARLKDLGVDFSKLSKDNPVFKIENDPRVTRVGRFIRRWSLDELPQFLNVLRGDMSLVGPRPEEAGVVARYSFFHRKRLAVKPGITGPMQVSGRGDLPLKQRLNLELAYIESWTLWSDLKICLKTIPVVLFGKGAY